MTASQEIRAVPWQAEARVAGVQKRTVRLLAAAQVVGGIGIGVSVSVGALLAESVAHSETYAGLARTAMTAGAAAIGIPLALLAQRRGRRTALSTGWLTAAVGGVVLIASAVITSVPLLVMGMLLFGVGSATNQQSRYAAADLAAPHRRARALSTVVWATTIGSVIGPNLADPGAAIASVLHLPSLTGAFVLATLCMALAALLLWAGLRPDPLRLARQQADTDQQQGAGTHAHATSGAPTPAREEQTATVGRALRHLRRSPHAAFAFVSIVVAHTTMGVIMTMTPVSMSENGAGLSIVGITISGHLLGMYALSPLVGWLADRFGHLPTAVAGQAVFLVSALLSGLSHGSVPLMMTGLFLLGLGWSFSLVAGSAMLTEATPTALRPGLQGTTDTAMNVVAALGAGLAGPLMHSIGFAGLNLAAATLVLPVALFWLLLARAH
ncbi:MFS transporter [Streptomyces tubbatahanensis]|uniref:MFS transporter n=1 Tax=Streptomyces tubbatahanensis TaxID=2923272 RepID=A0ABY3XQN2_9ACTN|nr:MFS transporter [Streptomyces tubbatahanensis]UNS96776.1 MFS transporter [Streptomyces tubbatahanensis]